MLKPRRTTSLIERFQGLIICLLVRGVIEVGGVRPDGGGRVRVAMGGGGEVVDGGADEECLLYANEDKEGEDVIELQGVPGVLPAIVPAAPQEVFPAVPQGAIPIVPKGAIGAPAQDVLLAAHSAAQQAVRAE